MQWGLAGGTILRIIRIRFWHGGSTGGYTSFVGFSTSNEQAVVILSNISSSHPSARANNRIPIPILLGQKLLTEL